ncbi:MAG: hypothetical protein ABI051_01960 [Vicinamibacterales bacterium]
MKPQIRMAALIAAVGLAAAPQLRGQGPAAAPPVDVEIHRAFTATYNLDYDAGLSIARQLVAVAPQESRAHRALATIVWLDVLFRRGAVTIDHYMGGITRSQLSLPKPPVELAAEFKQEATRALDLAQARRRQNSTDLQSLEDLGAAYGLQASYSASAEGSVVAAFSSARGAFDAGETLLSRDPRNMTAATLVGTYRYAVATLSLPSRMFAYIAGFGGGKDQGITLLETASQPGSAAHVEASTALALIYSREGRHADAARVLAGLAAEFPRNRLFLLEHASAMLRAGKAPQAESLLVTGLGGLDRDDRRKIPGERALWLYKRGLARLVLANHAGAAADFDLALRSEPVEWVKGRLHLASGKLADVQGRRAAAVAEYRQAREIGRAAEDPACVAEAARLMQTPFVLGKN